VSVVVQVPLAEFERAFARAGYAVNDMTSNAKALIDTRTVEATIDEMAAQFHSELTRLRTMLKSS